MIHPIYLAPLDPREQRRYKLRNLVHSVVLLGGMVALLSLCAWVAMGGVGVIGVLLGGVLGLLITPRISPRLMLALYRARNVGPSELPAVHKVLEDLTRRAGLRRTPALYYLPSALANAFTVGHEDDSAIVITDGLLRLLNLRELAGVLAHEVSHIHNHDLWIMNVSDTLARLTHLLAFVGIVLLFFTLPAWLAQSGTVPWLLIVLFVSAPTLDGLLQLALSRAREFDADLEAARLTGDPAGLALALEKFERVQRGIWERILLPYGRLPEPSFLRTHPDHEERVRRLLSLYEPEAVRAFRRPARVVVPQTLPPVTKKPKRHFAGLWY